MKNTEIFQALSQELRLRALLLISKEGEICVCELMHALQAEQPKISRHLTAMKNANLLTARRQAQWVYYTINRELEPWQKRVVKAAIEGARCTPIALEDHERLATMKNRPVMC